MPTLGEPAVHAHLVGGGETGALMRGRDWSNSPLGPPHAWPQSLRSVVGLMLGSKFPMFVAWGPDLGFVYNDAYAPILGTRHPAAMGRPFREIWSEIWPDISPLIDRALAGEATFSENLPLLMQRKGFAEETWFTFSYSPVRDESGTVAGMFCACQETTAQVLAKRRQEAEVERQRRQFAQAPGFICTLSGPDLVFDFVNDAHRRLFGDRSAVGRTIREAFPELAGQGYFEALDAVYRTGQQHVFRANPARIQPDPGGPVETLYLDFIYAPITDPAGRVTGIFCEGYDVTQAHLEALERAKAEAALAEREMELRQLADALPVLVSYMDADLRYQFVNRIYEDWFPLKREDLIGREVREVVGEAAFAGVKPWLDRALAGERLTFEQFMPYGGGGDRHIRVEYVPRVTTAGQVEGIYALVQDVSDMRRAEVALRASEEQLRLATDSAEVGLWDYDVGTGALYWTPRVREMFAVPADAPVTIGDFGNAIHPEDRDTVLAAFDAAKDPARRTVYDVEYRILGRSDGVLRWIAAKGRGLFDEDGRAVRVLGTALDITRRKADEARLRDLNETLERRVAEALAERRVLADIVNRADMLVQALDLEYRWIAINEAAAQAFSSLYGTSRPQPGDSMLAPLEGKPDQMAVARDLWSRAFAGEEFMHVATFGRSESDARSFEMRFRTLRDETGRIVGAYQMALDVTDRLREQARLRDAETALLQVQKMEAVGQLTGGIAHDFNNLLGAVVSGLELIRRRADDPNRVRMLADHSLAAAERGAKLTGQLLAFSRAQRLEMKAVGVHQVVEGMQELLARTLGPMIRLHLDLDGEQVAVLSDPIQLEMALLNLAINARDAMPGGGDLSFRARLRIITGDPELKDGDYVELAVTDTGTGMPPEVAVRAFDPFYTTKGIGKGTGLGLSQVYGIARQAGGTARIESRPGAGTTVRLLLPRTDLVPEHEGAEARAAAAGPEPQATVLVVDDDQDLRRMLAATLEAIGYRVLEAGDGAAGLAILAGTEPDLVIVDFAMPGMTGAEVARRVRADRPNLPIVFATGYADTTAIETAAGPDTPVLRKPFRMDELQAVVASALRKTV